MKVLPTWRTNKRHVLPLNQYENCPHSCHQHWKPTIIDVFDITFHVENVYFEGRQCFVVYHLKD